jgi:hypothetical protein
MARSINYRVMRDETTEVTHCGFQNKTNSFSTMQDINQIRLIYRLKSSNSYYYCIIIKMHNKEVTIGCLKEDDDFTTTTVAIIANFFVTEKSLKFDNYTC